MSLCRGLSEMPEILQMPPAKSAAPLRIGFACCPCSLRLGCRYGSSSTAAGIFMMSWHSFSSRIAYFSCVRFDASVNNTALCSSANSLCCQGLFVTPAAKATLLSKQVLPVWGGNAFLKWSLLSAAAPGTLMSWPPRGENEWTCFGASGYHWKPEN